MAEVTVSKWQELAAELEAMGIFKIGGWLGKKMLAAILEKEQDRFSSHIFNVFVAMPYSVVYVFERAKAELALSGEINRNQYVNRLANMPRDLSDEYRLQLVQGAYDSLIVRAKKNEELSRDEAVGFLDSWVAKVKDAIKADANVPYDVWNQELCIRNLDKSHIPPDLAEKNRILKAKNERLDQGIFWLKCIAAGLFIALVTYGMFAVIIFGD